MEKAEYYRWMKTLIETEQDGNNHHVTKRSRDTKLLKKSLHEAGIDFTKCAILINQDQGYSKVNGIKLNIMYPISYWNAMETYHSMKKTNWFQFKGKNYIPLQDKENPDKTRQPLLDQFSSRAGADIVITTKGSIPSTFSVKTLDEEYYTAMAKSRYVLCPHYVDNPGTFEHMWSYRFIEAMMVKSMPLLYKETPLSSNFTNGFNFVWNDLDSYPEPDQSLLDENFVKAKEKHSLSAENITNIKNTLI